MRNYLQILSKVLMLKSIVLTPTQTAQLLSATFTESLVYRGKSYKKK